MVEWLCTKERLNERGPYILVEWSCAKKRNKSVGTLNSGRMVVHIASAKITVREGNISRYSFYGQMLDCSVCNFQSMNSPMELNSLFSKFFCCITRFVTWHLIRCENGKLAKALMFFWNNSLRFNPFLMEADMI